MLSLRRAARTSPRAGGVFEATKRARALVAAGVALILISPFLSVVPAAAAELVPVVVNLSKTTSAPIDGTAGANESVTYDFTITCSSTQSDCVNLKLTDSFPAPLIFDSVNPNSNYSIGTTTNGFVLSFTNALDEGGVGLVAGETVSFQAIAHVSGTVGASFDGQTVINTAQATVDNPDSNIEASAPVGIIAPLVISSTIAKTITPTTLNGFAGTPVVFSLSAQNTSNAVIDTLEISDPAQAALPTNAYDYLTPTSLTVVFPSGANRVRVDRYTGTAWVNGTATSSTTPTLPAGVIKGLRFTFSNSVATTDIAVGATGSVTINTVTRAAVADLTTPFNGLNIASSQAVKATTLGTIVSVSKPFTINPAAIRPTATKVFSSHDVVSGENITATLTAQNGGDFTLSELAIVEPQTATTSFADQGIEFVSINQAQVFWPTGATSVDVTYVYDDTDPSPTITWTTSNTLPTPEPARTVIGFTANFKGTMAPGQYATVPFTAHTLPTATDLSTTNTIRVDAKTTTGLTASTTASDTLLRRNVRISTSITKIIAPSSIYANAGAPLLLSLQSRIDPRPTVLTDTTGSTIGATLFEIEDSDADFWDVFNPTNIVATEIPSGSQLQILYSTDGGASYPTTQELLASTTGPTSVNVAIPASLVATITGIKFVYTPSVEGTLLQPGFNVQPNIKVRLRTTERASGDPVFLPGATVARVESNTATTYVENSTSGQFDDAEDDAPATVQPLPADGGPGYDLIEKAWVEDEVLARSSQNATSVISWGTAGQEYSSVVISDTPDDSNTAVGDPSMSTVSSTVYDSFDLYSIAPITSATDPLIVYDAVSAVQYFSRTTNQWEPLNDTNATLCTLGSCYGGFPGYTLSTAERADAIGVRLVFVENPNRPDEPASASAPLKNSGVASTTTLARHISLAFQLRMALRSDASTAVLGSTRGQLYNTASAGQVSNVAGIEGRDATDAILWHENDNDEIVILDSSINVKATKTWIDGPLGVPPVGTAQSLFPISLMTVTAQNASVVPVNELTLQEPTGGTTPFSYVNIVQIDKLTGSTDTTSTIVLEFADGTFSAAIPINTLVTMTATQLQDVVGLTMTKAGPIAKDEIIGLQLHTQLREFVRGSTTVRTAPMTVQNQVTATVTDPGGTTTPPVATAPNNVVTDMATATLDIEAWAYGVVATKSISTTTVEYGTSTSTSTTGSSVSTDGLTPAVHGQPQTAAIQYDNGETISKRATVTVSGQPTGNVRTTDLVLEDTSPTFWNVYNFVALDATALSDTRKRVQVDVLIGNGAWGYGVDYDTSSGITSTCTGDTAHPDCWIIGTPSLTPTLPTMPSGSQVANIRGLRFTFTNADGSAWERDYNPPMTAKFTVDRRTTLVSSSTTAVPSTLFSYTGPTPGETTQGVFTNLVTATANARPSAGSAAVWSATADATAQIRYQHLPARVMIKKSPVGAQSLNTNIPYKIVVTNTGGTLDRKLGNVIVTDSLPVDTSVVPAATMLVIPNDEDGIAQTIGDVTSIRVADASNVTLTSPTFTATLGAITGDHQDIVFDFDDAWVLPRGASLTITVNLQFPPQLEAGTQVVNTATVTADQPFETCQWYVDNATVAQTPRTQVSDCYSSTTVYPLASAPVTIVKGVRGVGAGPLDATGTPIDSDPATTGIQPYDDLGVLKTVPGSSVNCNTPNVAVGMTAEYYRYPCVPITRPGGTEEWASTFTNGGNIGLTSIVAIDVLPAPSDLGVIVNEQRGSKWTPTLTSYPTLVNLPTDATYTVYYLTNRLISTQRCNGADIQATLGMTPSTNPAMTSGYQTCYTNTAPVDSVQSRNAAWQVLAPTADATTLASVVAMKFVISMTTANPLAPGSKLSIVYQSRTSSVVQVAETGVNVDNQSVAYNSIAAAAAGFDPTTNLVVPNRFVTEPRKVGVAMATGSIQLRKTANGAGAGYSASAFNLTATCTSAGTALAPITVAVTKNATGATIIHGLPLYASCDITEANTYGETVRVISPATVTAQAPQTAALETIFDPNPEFGAGRPSVEVSTATNTFTLTRLTITKTVDNSGAVDALAGGAAVTPSAFLFSISCRFNNGSTNNVVYTQSNISLNSGGSYTTPMDSASTTVQNRGIPVGSVCTVTETNARSAQSIAWTATVDRTSPLTPVVTTGSVAASIITLGSVTNTVAYTNTFGVASLTINKVIDGAWAASAATPAHTTGTFTLTVVCQRNINASAALETTFNGTFTLSAATSLTRTISNIAQGSTCTITEPGRAGATNFAITTTAGAAGDVITGITGANTRVITNSFDEASLAVTKTVETAATNAGGLPDAPYTIGVACTFQGSSVYGTGYSSALPMNVVFSAADFATDQTSTKNITGLPAGAACRITESVFPANATSVRINWATATTSGTKDSVDPAAPSALIPSLSANGTAGAITNTVTVTNSYGVGNFTVTKVLRGDASTAYGLGPFTIHVVCLVGTTTSYDDTVTLTPTHLSETISNLLTGSVCSAEETGYGRSAPDAVVYSDSYGATDDGAGVDVMGTNPVVTITNWYLTGSVTVTKSVLKDAGYNFGTGPFTVSLTCERDITGPAATVTTTETRVMDPATPSSMTQTFIDLPSGATCTLTETDDGDASSTVITDGTSTGTAATGVTFTVDVDSTIHSTLDQLQPAISVENTFTQASLVVTKAIDSDAVDANGDPLTYGPFAVSASCLFNGSPVVGDGFTASPMTHDLVAGTPWTITGLPTGAECTVTEDNVMSAVATSITVIENDGTASTSTVDQDPTPTIPTGSLVLGALPATNSVGFTNAYDEGSIELSKQILGLAATQWGTADFTVTVNCELADASTRADDTVFTGSYDRADLLAATPVLIEHLPTGAVCSIEETNDGTATATEITVTAPGDAAVSTTGTTASVSVGNDDDPIEAVIKNTFDYTSISVQKEVDGDPTGLYSVGPFEVTLECSFDGNAIDDSDIPDGLVRELSIDNSYYTEYTDLPVGADCSIEETKTGGANSTDIRLGDLGTPSAGTTFDLVTVSGLSDVYVTNHYEVGSLAVTKTTTGGGSFIYGDGSALYGTTGFEVTLACERDVDGVSTPVPLPYSAAYTLIGAEGYTHTFEQLPVGATCEITETKKGFASTSTAGAPVAIVADVVTGVPTVSIDVVNDFQLGTLALGKESLGLFAARYAGQSFQITVECWQDVDGTMMKIDPIKDGEVRTIQSGEVTAFEELPVPAECTFDELDNGGADMGVYSVAAVPVLGSTLTVDPGDTDVQLANLFLLAHSGSDADVWIIGALISLLSGVALVIVGRRRVRPTATR